MLRPFFRSRQIVVTKPVLFFLVFVVGALVAASCNSSTMVTGQLPGTVSVSISDPPSCMPPNGQFLHVFITIRSVQAHASATADDNSSGWVELAAKLNSKPMQIDLFSKPDTNCVLAQLGSTSTLPTGSIQQIRLLLVSNSPAASDPQPLQNACGPNGFNCVELIDGSFHELNLSSQSNTGLKIPPGQIVGGPIQVAAGQSVDINIDFNACASIVREGNNGQFRLKPTLTAGQVSPNNSGISGQVVDSLNKTAISGTVLVALEQTDNTGVDRIVMEAAADSNGNFVFCPLPTGMFDIVVVAVGSNNLPYNATAVLNVPNGTKLSALPLIAEKGAAAPATIQGFVTATTGTAPAPADVQLAALQVISLSGTPRSLNIPLETIQKTAVTPETDSTQEVSVDSPATCPAGSPANTNCAQYTLVVPASNPSFGVFSAAGTAFSTPAAGDVLYTVDARAFRPNSGGVSFCSSAEQMTNTDAANLPLKVTAAMTTNASRIDFKGCT